MIVKHILQAVTALMILMAATSCGDSAKQSSQDSSTIDIQEGVEVLYLHGKQRCATCNAIEKLTKEVIEKEFAQELQDGQLTYRVIDISTQQAQDIANQYEVSWSSLYINRWHDGKDERNNMTDFAFAHAYSSPEIFKHRIKDVISTLLK